MKQSITNYDDIRDKLNNGDLVLFKGKGFASLVIRWFCSLMNGMKPTKYSHIGFIYLNDNRVWLTESTTQMYKGYEKAKKGVRCIPMSITLLLYPGEIYLRQLKMVRDEKDIAEMRSYIDVHDGKPYEEHAKELAKSAKASDWDCSNDNSDFFCSELVAGLYLLWRLISHSKNSYSPDEFKEGGLVDMEMKTSIRKAELLGTVRLK